MPLPQDAYPLATIEGAQIRNEFVVPTSLDSVAISATASTVDTALVSIDEAVIFYASVECVVSFVGAANIPPAGAVAILILAGERASILIPQNTTGISVIGTGTTGGTLYIQKIIKWAGLVNPSSGLAS